MPAQHPRRLSTSTSDANHCSRHCLNRPGNQSQQQPAPIEGKNRNARNKDLHLRVSSQHQTDTTASPHRTHFTAGQLASTLALQHLFNRPSRPRVYPVDPPLHIKVADGHLRLQPRSRYQPLPLRIQFKHPTHSVCRLWRLSPTLRLSSLIAAGIRCPSSRYLQIPLPAWPIAGPETLVQYSTSVPRSTDCLALRLHSVDRPSA